MSKEDMLEEAVYLLQTLLHEGAGAEDRVLSFLEKRDVPLVSIYREQKEVQNA